MWLKVRQLIRKQEHHPALLIFGNQRVVPWIALQKVRRWSWLSGYLLFSALQHPNFNPKWISFVISKNLFANELNFNNLIRLRPEYSGLRPSVVEVDLWPTKTADAKTRFNSSVFAPFFESRACSGVHTIWLLFRCAAPSSSTTNIYLQILWCSAPWTFTKIIHLQIVWCSSHSGPDIMQQSCKIFVVEIHLKHITIGAEHRNN
jgi:hypothetical protein